MPISKVFVREATLTENKAKALHWFEKALQIEADGKSKKMIDMALDKACDFELASLDPNYA